MFNLDLPALNKINSTQEIDQLSNEQTKDLQRFLSIFTYPTGKIDGLIGSKTKTAWAEFKTDIYQGSPELIGTGSIEMINELLKNMSDRYDKYDFSTKTSTIESIKNEAIAFGLNLNSQIAYILATVDHETATTFKPVIEAFNMSDRWRKNNLRYYPFVGRGYVQLTWDWNYAKYSELLGIDLVKNPDFAMQSAIALFILIHGFKTGLFTGRKIEDYINPNKKDWVNCRRCINGMDKARHIADLANSFLKYC